MNKEKNYGELKLPGQRPQRNPLTGRFLKGHVPHNKGKSWAQYMKKRSQRRSARGWKNLEAHRPKSRPDTAGRSRKPVIAVSDDGRWLWFPGICAASTWIRGREENVGRCCHDNQRAVSRQGRKVNTDHKYKGVRFYFESDDKWTTKVRST